VNRITVSDLRTQLPEILERIALLKESFVVVKHGKPYAILGPVVNVVEGNDA
jgi:antitoxin (DNA-binding transcriptional repressor) of toxin-antitoxin stability system